jgi:hypothetical protein
MREIYKFPTDKDKWPQFICDIYDIDFKDVHWDELTASTYYIASTMVNEEGHPEKTVCVFPLTHLEGHEYEINWLFDSGMPFACDCSLDFINKMVCVEGKAYPWRDRVRRYHAEKEGG